MARIVGVDLPKNKRGEIGLTYIYGIGRSTARKILDEAGIDHSIKVKDWSDDHISKIRKILNENFKLEGELEVELELLELVTPLLLKLLSELDELVLLLEDVSPKLLNEENEDYRYIRLYDRTGCVR